MEAPPLNIQESNPNRLKESAKLISDMYIEAAENYLEVEDPLKARIINYYSTRLETEQELLHVLGKKDENEISTYIQNIRDFTADKTRFIEKMEKLYELQDVHRRRRQYLTEDRIATEEEYKLGAYADVLESQVRDAVLAAQKKGYLTFQSGFKEKNDRDQFMDFYNKNISIPKETLEYLGKRSIEVRIDNFDDRTTLTLHPTGANPIRLSEWKEIWKSLINKLPPADTENVEKMKLPLEHADFRRKQDSIREE